VDPNSVTLEISESSAMNDPAESLEALTRLRTKKFRLSIDDFGTGYSSMLQLVRLPFTEIKIDKDFVGIADSSEEARSVIKCIIDLSRSLGMSTVAEGVESQRTREFLTACGCGSFQGYLVCKPLGEDRLPQWAKEYCDSQNDSGTDVASGSN
jgi:EAL domain-containing protein (putative c-di-GMP-specific phosphodiesterase class I)